MLLKRHGMYQIKYYTCFVTRTSATCVTLCLSGCSDDHCFGCRSENDVSCLGGLQLPAVTDHAVTLTQMATISIYMLFMALFLISLEFSLASHNQYIPQYTFFSSFVTFSGYRLTITLHTRIF